MARSLCMLGLVLLGVVAVSGSSNRRLKQFGPKFTKLTCDFQGPFPYMVSLKGRNGEHLCGGVLISNTSVLTSAHCVDPLAFPKSTRYPNLSLGGFDLDNPIERRSTSEVIEHPGWRGNRRLGNDLAILKMNAPTCIDTFPSIGVKGPFSMPTIFLGFGRTSTDGPFSNQLLSGKFTNFNGRVCSPNIDFHHHSTSGGRTFCSKGPAGTAGVCEGDEGGPAITRPTMARFEDDLAGIASYTAGSGECSDRNAFSVFTDLKHYRQWILANM